ncbi:hypothetical protein JCM8547_000787 [Rhodosporidiobolus lusitaniae]
MCVSLSSSSRPSSASTTSTSTVDSIKNTVSDAVNYVTETAKEYTAGTSKEANKARRSPLLPSPTSTLADLHVPFLHHDEQEVAKGNTDASLTDRASAGFDAVGDKLQESKHSASAEANKESMKH